MKKIQSSILMLFFSIIYTGCIGGSKTKSNVDKFYSKKGEYSIARIPFLKPYEATSVSDKFGWVMDLEGADGDLSLENIKKATVVDSLILVYSTNTRLHGMANVKESWYIVVPKQHIEKGFLDHHDYLSFLNKYGVKKEPRLHNIDSIASYFEFHETIDWNAID